MSEATQTSAEIVTLHQWLAALIDRLSDPAERAKMQEPWRLRLCYDKREPKMSWAEVVSPREEIEFSYGKRDRTRFANVTEIPLSAVLLCGELWEDSKRQMAKQAQAK